MSGPSAGRALRDRFETIRRGEIERLAKKLRGLTDDERHLIEAITIDVIQAIARVPERALRSGLESQRAADALTRLFSL